MLPPIVNINRFYFHLNFSEIMWHTPNIQADTQSKHNQDIIQIEEMHTRL